MMLWRSRLHTAGCMHLTRTVWLLAWGIVWGVPVLAMKKALLAEGLS